MIECILRFGASLSHLHCSLSHLHMFTKCAPPQAKFQLDLDYIDPTISHINECVDFTLLFILVESLGNDSHYVLQGILCFAHFQVKCQVCQFNV